MNLPRLRCKMALGNRVWQRWRVDRARWGGYPMANNNERAILMRMFCFHCRDGEDGGKRRSIHREAHLKFIADIAEHLVIAGPLKRADGLIIGSLLIVKAEDEAGARAVLDGDPYLTGGVWQAIRVDEFSPLLGDWA